MMTALEEAVLLLLGYEQGQFGSLMSATQRPYLNPFTRAIAKLQAEIAEKGKGEGGKWEPVFSTVEHLTFDEGKR